MTPINCEQQDIKALRAIYYSFHSLEIFFKIEKREISIVLYIY